MSKEQTTELLSFLKPFGKLIHLSNPALFICYNYKAVTKNKCRHYEQDNCLQFHFARWLL